MLLRTLRKRLKRLRMISGLMRVELMEESEESLKTVRGMQVCPERQNISKISRSMETALGTKGEASSPLWGQRPGSLKGTGSYIYSRVSPTSETFQFLIHANLLCYLEQVI